MMRLLQAGTSSKLVVAAWMVLSLYPSGVEAMPINDVATTTIRCVLEEVDYACSNATVCPELDPMLVWTCTDFDTKTRYSFTGDNEVFNNLVVAGNQHQPSAASFQNVRVTVYRSNDPLVIFDRGTIEILPHSTIQFVHDSGRRKLALVKGNNTILVVRLKDSSGDATKWTASKLSNEVFGTHGDTINLKSVIEGCSNKQLLIKPYPTSGTNAVVNGVVELTLAVDFDVYDNLDPRPTNTTLNWRDLKDYVIQQLKNKGFPDYNNWRDTNDQVILFTSDDYKLGRPTRFYSGIASVGSGWAIINGITTLGILVHEYGHNLQLRHSGTNETGAQNEYGDR
jgi:hypothetical protein